MQSIRKAKWRMHYQYDLWKYVVFILVAVFAIGLLYQATAPRPAPDRWIKVMAAGSVYSHELTLLAEKAMEEELPDQQIDIGVTGSTPGQPDSDAMTKITVMFAAQDGDVYIMRKELFEEYAPQEVFVPLEDLIASGDLVASETQPDWAYGVGLASGEKHLYGICLEELPGLRYVMDDPSQYVISMTTYSVNQKNALRFINWLLEDMQQEWIPPGIGNPEDNANAQ